MKKSVLLLASMLMGTSAFAQGWTKPTLKDYGIQNPQSSGVLVQGDLDTPGAYGYLFNEESGAFFLGANDWGTRASVCDTLGHMVFLQDMDGSETVWSIVNYVLQGGAKDSWRRTFVDNPTNIWVDNNTGANAETWSITKLADGKFTIGNIAETADGTKPFENMTLGAYKDKCPVGDTRLYMADKATAENFGDTWYFVNEEEYTKYTEAVKAIAKEYYTKADTYNHAVALGKTIADTKAKYAGIVLTPAENIYNNLSSTIAELDSAANKIIPTIVVEFQKGNATPENPGDMTAKIINPNFDGIKFDGWGGSGFGAGGTTDECAERYEMNYDTYQDIADLPGGIYKVLVNGFYRAGSIANDFSTANDINVRYANLYAKSGDQEATNYLPALAAGASDTQIEGLGTEYNGKYVPNSMKDFVAWENAGYYNDNYVIVPVEEGDPLRIGVRKSTQLSTDWTIVDTWRLLYLGQSIEAYNVWYQGIRKSIIDKMNALITPETKYDKNQKKIFEEALAKGDAAKTKDELFAVIPVLQAAADSTIASIEAYTELENLVNEYIEDETEYGDGPILTFMDMLSDDIAEATAALEYLKEEDIPAEKLVEVVPFKVLTECTYSNEYVRKYAAALKELHAECASKSMIPGTVIKLEDANFTDPNGKGWTKVEGTIAWTGGIIPGFPVAEAYKNKFDFYQEVTVPDGIYSLSLNGFARLETDPEVTAEIYMNDFATSFQNILDDQLPFEDAVDGINCYRTNGDQSAAITSNPKFEGSHRQSPNDAIDLEGDEGYYPNGMEGASVAFSAGRYEAKVYGLVEGGKIKLGARCTSAGQWVLWSNFQLTYEGETEEAVEELSESFQNTANKFIDEKSDFMSTPAISALQNAINALEEAEEKADILAAIKTLNTELKNAKANVAAVEAFTAAKEAMDEAANDYSGTATNEAIAMYDKLSGIEYYDLETEAIEEYTPKFNDCAAALRIPKAEEASDENPIVFTQVIVNPDFEANNYDGWTLVKREGASGNYQTQNGFNGGKSMEFWSGTNGVGTKFDFYQDIANLPAGTYELTVDASNSLNGQNRVNKGRAVVYAAKGDGETFTYVSDTIAVQSEDCAALYENYHVIIKLEEGQTLRIGAMNTGDLEARWVMIDNFALTYYGKESAKSESEGKDAEVEVDIDEAPAAAVAPVAIYSAAGAKINALQKGINIVVMSDGTVAKILVK